MLKGFGVGENVCLGSVVGQREPGVLSMGAMKGPGKAKRDEQWGIYALGWVIRWGVWAGAVTW